MCSQEYDSRLPQKTTKFDSLASAEVSWAFTTLAGVSNLKGDNLHGEMTTEPPPDVPESSSSSHARWKGALTLRRNHHRTAASNCRDSSQGAEGSTDTPSQVTPLIVPSPLIHTYLGE
jgi:hypothetical protein